MADISLFIGDSVTDCNRLDHDGIGDGYVKKIRDSGKVSGEIINRGISGNRIGDLRDRWQSDVMAHRPSTFTVLIGVNDTWRRYDDNDPTSAEDFTNEYRKLLQEVSAYSPRLFLCQPFILPVQPEMSDWLGDLNEKIEGIKQLVTEFGATYIPYGDYFRELLAQYSMEELAGDGIHPTDLGHQLMANLWLSYSV